ncbi:hypothetical protein BGW36DRAFT_400990 [Talaromyces proteolyticus]|uniref:Galactosyl transferase GMA12/MNN10 family protein n=1 Tax=Talaromyces proteolyticus TaxID=1131652 RepID=A0AAD4KHJ2_9EURO|nr:uncharacterized protein BGW36DRAFT_400990 [Talaromyces proteolyticus]KAH8690559.1 hypothetical protein BGW36DRAFT_400990 [Talaromyces proteolyticus]
MISALRLILATTAIIWLLNLVFHISRQHLQPKIGKVTMIYGDSSPIYERVLRTHVEHSRRLGYPLFVLRRSILDGGWNKNAILLSILLQELEKPLDEQLEWLFWFDSDMVLMNPNMPLETFLPPPHVADVHMLLTYDWNGMNNGAFPIRVHPWSIELLSAAIAFPIMDRATAEQEVLLSDQSVLGHILDENHYFSQSVEYCPLRWFNAYMSLPNGELDPDTPEHLQVHPGDLLVHFPGTPRDALNETMQPYLEIAESHLPKWELSVEHTGHIKETQAFWKSVRPSDH